jgi:hypothetical protein
LKLTKVDRLIKWLGEKKYQPEWSGILELLIDGISAQVEKELRRHVLIQERTVQADVDAHSAHVALKAYPITAVASVKNDPSRDFGSGTLVDTDLYFVDEESGEILFDFELSHGPGALQVVYTGGMAVDTDAFILAFADIVIAIDQQVAYEFGRKGNPGVLSQNPSDFGGGSSYFVSPEWGEKFGEMQPKLLKAIQYHQCKVRAW